MVMWHFCLKHSVQQAICTPWQSASFHLVVFCVSVCFNWLHLLYFVMLQFCCICTPGSNLLITPPVCLQSLSQSVFLSILPHLSFSDSGLHLLLVALRVSYQCVPGAIVCCRGVRAARFKIFIIIWNLGTVPCSFQMSKVHYSWLGFCY